ncbi:hypothetical protein Nmel_015960 [Mimus melanotis]
MKTNPNPHMETPLLEKWITCGYKKDTDTHGNLYCPTHHHRAPCVVGSLCRYQKWREGAPGAAEDCVTCQLSP